MKFYLFSLMLLVGSVSAQGIPVTANDYTPQEMRNYAADAMRLASERAELAEVQRIIKELPKVVGGESGVLSVAMPPDLSNRLRTVVRKLQARAFLADEYHRRMIRYLSEELKKEPDHPWAEDWRMKIADAQKSLLRAPLDYYDVLNESWPD